MAEINIPTGPLDTEPGGAIGYEHGQLASANREALAMALDGLELGEWDRRIAEWLAGWEPSTVATICAWLHRARAQERAATMRLGLALGQIARIHQPRGPMCAECPEDWPCLTRQQLEAAGIPAVLASVDAQARERGSGPAVPYRGGPELDAATEADYRAEQADHDGGGA